MTDPVVFSDNDPGPEIRRKLNEMSADFALAKTEVEKYVDDAAASATSAGASATTATTAASTATTQAGIATSQAGVSTTKAGEADASAITAATQAGIATTQAGIATASATAAATKASEASTSATNAAASAVTATTKAAAAGTSAANAAASVAAAAASAATATTKAGEAATSATGAASSASAADTSATAAAGSATTATTQATTATAQATLSKDWATKTDGEVVTGQGFGAKKYATDAAASATSASTSAATATTQAGIATTQATTATTQAGIATTQATTATTKASEAATSASDAAASANAAATSAAKGLQWADADQGVQVEPGKYSAKHWAAQAQATATGSLIYRGAHSAASGVYPPTPALGDYYRISAAGSMGGVEFAAGDSLIYNGSGWDKIDSTDAVTSVAGRVGAVTLAKGDVGLGNVDNTSDASKPISTATQTALSGKEPTINAGTTAQYWRGDKTWRDFFTDVRAATLTGLSTATNVVITAADTVLSALGKLQKQVSDNLTTLTSHTGNTSNPHGVTKAQVGLGNVDNTSDANKPVSTAAQAALNLKANLASPTFTGTVGGITKAMVGLANVDNTSDLAKPISTATQTALDGKANTSHTHTAATTVADGFMSAADKAKLDGVAVAATANATDAQLRDRSTHTGTQAISTVTGLQTALDAKQPLDADLTAIAGLTGTTGLLKKTAADTWTLDTASYQPALVSGANIKTVNGQSVLGSGDLAISGGGGAAGFEQTFLLMGA